MKIDDAVTTIRALAERFPKAFYPPENAKHRKPLRIGIFKDIQVAAPEIDTQQLRVAMRVYTHSGGYLYALSRGDQRVDLDGNPVENVSERDQARAKEILTKRKKKLRDKDAEAERMEKIEEAKKLNPQEINAAKPVLRLKTKG
jgi:ProP effector